MPSPGDIPGNIRANMAQVPRASNLLANKTALQGQKTQNALGRQSLQMGKQTMRANEQAIGANALSQQNQVMSMVHQLGASIGEAALQDPNALPMLQQELVRLGQPEDKVQSLSDPRALETFVNASKAAVGGAYGLPGALTNTSLPSDVRSNLYWQSLTPEQQESELARRRAAQLVDTGAGTEVYSPVRGTTTGPISGSATAESVRNRASRDAAATAAAGQGGVNLTPAQRAVDDAFADEYTEWVARGGFADVRKGLNQLAGVRGQLTAEGADLTGGLFQGLAPDFALAIFDPQSLAAREDVEEVVQRNLRLILGAQFTEREGERLIARAYNPRLSEDVNAERVARLMTAIDTAAQMKDAASRYYEQNGTLAGWNGTLFTIDDFYDAIEGTESRQEPTVWVDSNGIPNGARN